MPSPTPEHLPPSSPEHLNTWTPKHLQVRPDVAAMQPYTPIMPFEVLSSRLGRSPEEIVKLDANENPYGPSPKTLAALASGKYFHIYPDPESNELRQALSQFTGVPKEWLMAGAGADELIDVVLRAVLNPGEVVIDCPPSFGMYPFSTHVNSGQYVAVPRRADFSVDVAAVETAVSHHPTAKLLFLCSPNNPDGSLISDDDLHRLLKLPILIVLDEAYIEFGRQLSVVNSEQLAVNSEQSKPETLNTKLETQNSKLETLNSKLKTQNSKPETGHLHWVLKHPNLVVLRTFSKLAGLAGLRVGYGAFPDWLLPHLWKIKQPYNVNVAASMAAIAALQDEPWLQEKVNLIIAERERLSGLLQQFPFLHVYPSHSNFVLCAVAEGSPFHSAYQLKLALEQAGILVRYFNKPDLQHCIRISVGRPSDTDFLIQTLQKLTEFSSQNKIDKK